MSDRDIRKLYEGIHQGDNHKSPPCESDIYASVYNRQLNEDYSIVDQLATMDTGEYKAFFLTKQGWKGVRLTQLQVEEMHEEAVELTDRGNMIEAIKEIATGSSIIFDVAERSSSDVMRSLRKFIIDSAIKTQEQFPDQYTDANHAANTILAIIRSGKLQQQLISFMNGKEQGSDEPISENPYMFNLFNAAALNQTSNLGIFFDLESNPDMLYMMPAGEAHKARGAAGPGEALLSFIYGGQKPEGAGDIILSSDKRDTIELKFEGGRVGKNIVGGKTVKTNIRKLFVQNIDQAHQLHGGNMEKDPVYRVPMGDNNEFQYMSSSKIRELAQTDERYSHLVKMKDNKEVIALPQKALIKVNAAKGQIAQGTTTFQTLTLAGFLKDYTGIPSKHGVPIDGPYVTSAPNYLGNYGNTTLSQLLNQIPGHTPQQQIVNLVGIFHLKNYLTHVQNFKWFVVYRRNGDGVCLTSEQILKLDPIELLDQIDNRELMFEVKDDASGYGIKFQ